MVRFLMTPPRPEVERDMLSENFDNSTPPVSSRRMLSVQEAAARVGLSKSSLNKLRVYGGGPVFLKLGRSVRYDPYDLDSWLASHRRNSTSEQASI